MQNLYQFLTDLAALQAMTVEQMIFQEVEHARQHLLEVDEMLKQRPR